MRLIVFGLGVLKLGLAWLLHKSLSSQVPQHTLSYPKIFEDLLVLILGQHG